MRWVLKIALLALLSLAAIFSISMAFLTVTSPKPRPSEGWSRLTDMSDSRGEVAMAALETADGPRVYMLGGIRGIGTSGTVTVYDPDADAWSPGPELPQARNHAAAAVLDGKIYLSGGYSR